MRSAGRFLGSAGFGGRPFLRIFAADAILRTAYQMGKTPVLPIFAAALGASDILLGLVVAISTLTGIIVKPIVGFLSDRQGRGVWLFIAAALFIATPFAYGLVSTPEQLFALRLVHGLATAILGPVSLALVAEMAVQGRATRMGVFGMARAVGYVLAPVSAAFLLTMMAPATLFMVTGMVAAVALLPVIALQHRSFAGGIQPTPLAKPVMARLGALARGFAVSFATVARLPAIWIAGGLEMLVNMAAYAVKAFLPLHIIAASETGYGILLAGLFFSLQEAVHLLLRAPGGMAADRFGRLPVIGTGVLIMAAALFSMPHLAGDAVILGAVGLGAAQAMIFPASLAFVADHSGAGMGTGMGLYGALRNLGKVIGPVMAGLVLTVASFDHVLMAASALLSLLAGFVWVAALSRRQPVRP